MYNYNTNKIKECVILISNNYIMYNLNIFLQAFIIIY